MLNSRVSQSSVGSGDPIGDPGPRAGIKFPAKSWVWPPGAVALIILGTVLIADLLGDDAPGSTSQASSPLIAMNGEWQTLPDAEIVGSLDLDSGCLSVDKALVIFFDGSTKWDEESKSVVSGDGDRYALSTQVRWAGGYMPFHENISRYLSADEIQHAEDCIRRLGGHEVAVTAIAQ